MEKQDPLGLRAKENRKREIGPCAVTWMDLETVMPSGVSQTEKGKYQMVSLMCGLKKRGLYNFK